MDLMEQLRGLTRQTHQRNFYGRLDNQRVLGEPLRTEGIQEGDGYFQIRLAEMFLKDKRRWWFGFNPMTIAVTDFLYNNARKSVPVYIGNQILQSVEKQVGNQKVEYRNTNILGPVAYCGGDVGLFVGLFRVQVNDFSRQLFDFLETIIGSFSLTQLGPYLSLADNVGKGISGLLGMEEVQLQVGHRNVFNTRETDASRFREGYWVIAEGPLERERLSQLWVRDGILHVGDHEQRLKPFDECDFCLVKIEQFEERNDYRSLSFHAPWKKALEALYAGALEEADRLFLSLIREVAISPDLIRKQRFRLIQLYKANYEKEIEVFKGIRATPLANATRGGRIRLDATAVIQHTAYKALKRGYDPDVSKALMEVSRNLDQILAGRKHGTDMEDAEMAAQMETLAKISTTQASDPEALADAIVIDTLDPQV